MRYGATATATTPDGGSADDAGSWHGVAGGEGTVLTSMGGTALDGSRERSPSKEASSRGGKESMPRRTPSAAAAAKEEAPWWRSGLHIAVGHGYLISLLSIYVLALDKTNLIHFGFVALVVLLLAAPRNSRTFRNSGWVALTVYSELALLASYIASIADSCGEGGGCGSMWAVISLPPPDHIW